MTTRSRPVLHVSLQGSTVQVTPGQPWYVGIGADCNIRLPLTGPAEHWFVIRHAGVWTVRAVDDLTQLWVDGVAVPSDRSIRVGTAPSQQLRVQRGTTGVTLTLTTPAPSLSPGDHARLRSSDRPDTGVTPELSRSAAQFLTSASAVGWPGFRPIPGTTESGIVLRRTLVSGPRSATITPSRDGDLPADATGGSVYQLICPDGAALPGELRDEGMLITSAGRLLTWSVALDAAPAVLDAPPPSLARCMEYPKRPVELPEAELWHLLHEAALRRLTPSDAEPGAHADPEPHATPESESEPAPAPAPAPKAAPEPAPEPEPATATEPEAAPEPEPELETEPDAADSGPVSLRQWNTPASVAKEHQTGPTPVPASAGTGGHPQEQSPAALAEEPTRPAPPPGDPGNRSAPAPAAGPPPASAERPRPAWWREAMPLPETIVSVASFILIMQKGGWPGAISLPGSAGPGVVLARSIRVGDLISEVALTPGADLGPTVYERFRPNGGRFPTGYFREEGIVLGANGRLYGWDLPMEKYAHIFDAPPDPLGVTLRRELRPRAMEEDELLPLLTAALNRAARHG